MTFFETTPDACARPQRAPLRRPDARPGGGAGAGGGGARSPGVRPDRLGQDGRLRPGDGGDAARRRDALRAAPTRRSPSSSRRRANLRCRSSASCTGSIEYTGARIVACVGGMDRAGASGALAEGAHIVVGTPGRLRDHIERGALDRLAAANAWCSTKPTRCSTSAFAKISNSFSKRRRPTSAA